MKYRIQVTRFERSTLLLRYDPEMKQFRTKIWLLAGPGLVPLRFCRLELHVNAAYFLFRKSLVIESNASRLRMNKDSFKLQKERERSSEFSDSHLVNGSLVCVSHNPSMSPPLHTISATPLVLKPQSITRGRNLHRVSDREIGLDRAD